MAEPISKFELEMPGEVMVLLEMKYLIEQVGLERSSLWSDLLL